MGKEQPVCEQLTLSDFKKWSSTALKTFKNIMSVVFLSLLLIFELIQQAALMNFMLYLNIFKTLKTFMLNISKNIAAYLLLCNLLK